MDVEPVLRTRSYLRSISYIRQKHQTNFSEGHVRVINKFPVMASDLYHRVFSKARFSSRSPPIASALPLPPQESIETEIHQRERYTEIEAGGALDSTRLDTACGIIAYNNVTGKFISSLCPSKPYLHLTGLEINHLNGHLSRPGFPISNSNRVDAA
ncbi:hypothetical protein RRG08_020128 [Elysia crispata]|uniref:Uncharacterized protein n=1 Tax=Elysia crispata TaxID=231223 RepID=A0AAE1A4P0_9GAST|nr:hypothetical protein RRG08_020128 [Elysia crispata]